MDWLKNILPTEWWHWVLWILCGILLIRGIRWLISQISIKFGEPKKEELKRKLEKTEEELKRKLEKTEAELKGRLEKTEHKLKETEKERDILIVEKKRIEAENAYNNAFQTMLKAIAKTVADEEKIKKSEAEVRKAFDEGVSAAAAMNDAETKPGEPEESEEKPENETESLPPSDDIQEENGSSQQNIQPPETGSKADVSTFGPSKEVLKAKRSELIRLRSRMERTNFWFHLVRNNPRHREQYYFALIAMVGYENWKNIDPTVRMNWESARLSFDRMYGIAKDLAENAEKYAVLFHVPAAKPETADAAKLAQELNTLNLKNDLLSGKLDKLSNKLDDLTKILPPQEKVKEVRDALNAWIPPDGKADKE